MSLEERVAALPTSPGVYLFKSAAGKVLYVGKAQSLRQRVRQYVAGGDGRFRIPLLVERAADVEVVVTKDVNEALLLENELIKQHKPTFNVRLRDDKQYLVLRLDPRDEWPRLTQRRRFERDGASYFGPYTSSVAMKDAVSNLRRIFPLRSCRDAVFRDYARRGRPCIEYEMKRCAGPCVGHVDKPAYDALVHGTTLFLRGQTASLVDDLRRRMLEASAAERYEDAAQLRNQIGAVERTVNTQQIVAERPVDRDVFGFARSGGEVEIRTLHVREGRVVGSESHAFSDVKLDDGEVVGSFLGQYYAPEEARPVPEQILSAVKTDDATLVEALVSERAKRRVPLRTPQRGADAELVEMATANAALGLEQRLAARESLDAAFGELRERLGLAREPRRIECYDVSTLHGTLTVASRVVFEEGQPVKADYRRYRIREAAPDDDYACLREVMQRRLARAESEPLPDLLMVDGGKGQLGVVTAAVSDAALEVECVGIAKERDEESAGPRVRRSGGLKAERLFRPGRKDAVMLASSSRGLLLLQRIRDESHRFAITFQRELRSKLHLTSILEELPGIGPTKKRALLRELGSLKAVRAASAPRLAEVRGVSARDAAVLRRFFDALESDAPGADDGATVAADAEPEASDSASQAPRDEA